MDLICCEDMNNDLGWIVDGAADGGAGDAVDAISGGELASEGNLEALHLLVKVEARYRPDAAYFEAVDSAIGVMDAYTRGYLIDYFFETQKLFNFSDMTTSMAINYIDRFMSKFVVREDQRWVLELAATACISIASKMEEVQMCTLTSLQACSGTAFDASAVMKMERLVLDTLGWEMNAVTVFSYLDRYIIAAGVAAGGRGSAIRSTAARYLRNSHAEIDLAKFRPSTLAAACVLSVLEECAGAGEASGCAAGAVEDLLGLGQERDGELRACKQLVEALLGRQAQGARLSPVSVLCVDKAMRPGEGQGEGQGQEGEGEEKEDDWESEFPLSPGPRPPRLSGLKRRRSETR